MMKMHKGETPIIKLTPERIQMLQQINFDFKTKPRVVVPFESRVEALKRYREKHGHMRVSRKEDQSLSYFIVHVKESLKKMQEGTKTKIPIKLTSDRIKMLKQIGFDFKSGSQVQIPFESHIAALKRYRAKHNHIHVSMKEDKALWTFMSKIRLAVKRLHEGKNPHIKLPLDRLAALQEIGFDCRPKRGSDFISGVPSTNCSSSKRQRVEERLHKNNE